MKRLSIVVRAQWDPEAEMWVATSDDLPGLATEASTQAGLVSKLEAMIPELLEGEDIVDPSMVEVPVVIMSEQIARVRLRA